MTNIMIYVWIWHESWEYKVTDEKPSKTEIDDGLWVQMSVEVEYWKAYKAAEKLYILGKKMFISELPFIF